MIRTNLFVPDGALTAVRAARQVIRYLIAVIKSAMSAISARLSERVGMFGCGLSRRKASLFASKPGSLATDANGGA